MKSRPKPKRRTPFQTFLRKKPILQRAIDELSDEDLAEFHNRVLAYDAVIGRPLWLRWYMWEEQGLPEGISRFAKTEEVVQFKTMISRRACATGMPDSLSNRMEDLGGPSKASFLRAHSWLASMLVSKRYKKTPTATLLSSLGSVRFHLPTGVILECGSDCKPEPGAFSLGQIRCVDVLEWEAHYNDTLPADTEHDILDFGLWYSDEAGDLVYDPPCADWRKDCDDDT